MILRFISGFLALALVAAAAAQTRTSTIDLNFAKSLGPMEMDRIGLGGSGISPDPSWHDRVAEIRALHPRIIRLVIQQYFDVLPAEGQYRFDTLDASVDDIVQAGAIPLMDINLKPPVLFPKMDPDVTDPSDYSKWEELIYRMVLHYKEKGLTGLYWEMANEGDIGEVSGTPNHFTPESYIRYYQHTAEAVLRADPTAHVGGPAAASWTAPVLPAVLTAAAEGKIRLDFVTWHIYVSDPKKIEDTIKSVKALIAQHSNLHPETFLDEWNMELTKPPDDPRIMPAFIAETAWRMKKQGLDYSCYFHIRDYRVDRNRFIHSTTPGGASFMASWWNWMPQYGALFDYENEVRPSYFSFLLLGRVTGERLQSDSNDDNVHAFLSYDSRYLIYNLMFWNFSDKPVKVRFKVSGLPEEQIANRRSLDAETPSNEENARLRWMPDLKIEPNSTFEVDLKPYAVESWVLEPKDRLQRLLSNQGNTK